MTTGETNPPGASSLPPPHDDPQQPWYRGITPYMWLVLLIASLGWVFDVFEGQLFVAFMERMMTDLEPQATATQKNAYNSYANSAFLIGGGLGGVLFGMLSDRIGDRLSRRSSDAGDDHLQRIERRACRGRCIRGRGGVRRGRHREVAQRVLATTRRCESTQDIRTCDLTG